MANLWSRNMNITEINNAILNSYLAVLQKNNILCDITFVVGSEKEKISCHKIFLAARSPVFETMFTERWASGSEIDLPDVEPRVFHMFLEYVYAGKTFKDDVLDVSEVEMLIYLVDKYDVSFVMQKVIKKLDHLKFSTQNVLQIHGIPTRYNLRIPALQYRAAKFMIRHFSKLMLEPSFESMDAKLLEMCVIERSGTMQEIDVFNGLMKWSEARCKEAALETCGENKRRMLGDIFGHIQFARISFDDFAQFVVPSNILTGKEQLIVLKDRALTRSHKGSSPTVALDSSVPWTRGTVRNRTESRRRSELLDQYFEDSMAMADEINDV